MGGQYKHWEDIPCIVIQSIHQALQKKKSEKTERLEKSRWQNNGQKFGPILNTTTTKASRSFPSALTSQNIQKATAGSSSASGSIAQLKRNSASSLQRRPRFASAIL